MNVACSLLLGSGLAMVLAACAAEAPPSAPHPASSPAPAREPEPVLVAPPRSRALAPPAPGTITAPPPSQSSERHRYDRRSQPRAAAVDVYDCSDFTDDEAAQAAFLRAGRPDVDPNDLDRDGDGSACEWEAPEASPPSQATGSTGPACHQVAGHYRGNGTYVRPHLRCR